MSESGFIVVNKSVEERLRAHMRAEDVTPAMLTLVRVGVAVHEHAFHYPAFPKEAVAEIATDGFDAGLAYRAKVPAVLRERKAAIAELLAASANIRRVFGFAYMCAATGMSSREAFIAFVSDAWDAGAHQHRVNECLVEGSLNNELGVALNFACHLAMQGKSKGLIS